MSAPVQSSPWPARLDFLQSVSGLALALFMLLHAFFVASILLGADAMWAVARFFEGTFLFGRPVPWLVSLLAAGVFALFVLHAWLALRKFPTDWRQHAAYWRHMREMRHGDSTLWFVQVITGFGMFFLVPVHLYEMLMHPELIGPYESADRLWSGRVWPLSLAMLFLVQVHLGAGLYRLAVKWLGLGNGQRRALRRFATAFVLFFLTLGLFSTAAYIRLGMAHAPNAGEPYVPAWQRTAG